MRAAKLSPLMAQTKRRVMKLDAVVTENIMS